MDNLHPIADDADPADCGELLALVGELYLVILAILILAAALSDAVEALPGIVPTDDPAIAAVFTA